MLKINQINELGANSKTAALRGHLVDNKASVVDAMEENELGFRAQTKGTTGCAVSKNGATAPACGLA